MNKNHKNGLVKRLLGNGTAMMIFQIAKIVFPFVTLPYLTRVLTTDSYGVVTYTKVIMNYMQVFIDFGFLLSATKDVVNAKNNHAKTQKVINETFTARLILGLAGFVIISTISLALPLLRANFLFSILSYTAIFGTIFLFDFLFRGIEKMHIITVRFVIMKIISTALTFLLIKSDADLLLIPILDIISTLIAILLVALELKKLDFSAKLSSFKSAIPKIKDSAIYFLSSAASTSLNAFSTIIIGIYSTPTDVAIWGLAMQIIGTITACYNPFSDSIYPEMIRSKNFNIIKNILKIFLPIVVAGCALSFVISDKIFLILGGEDYLPAAEVFRWLIPVLFFGFLSIIFGWPCLGPIGKAKHATVATIISTIFNLAALLLLAFTNNFTLINIAITRVLTELLMFLLRFFFTMKYRSLFSCLMLK